MLILIIAAIVAVLLVGIAIYVLTRHDVKPHIYSDDSSRMYTPPAHWIDETPSSSLPSSSDDDSSSGISFGGGDSGSDDGGGSFGGFGGGDSGGGGASGDW